MHSSHPVDTARRFKSSFYIILVFCNKIFNYKPMSFFSVVTEFRVGLFFLPQDTDPLSK